MIELDYWGATWCGPCKAMKPVLTELEQSGWTVNRIDVDDRAEDARQLRIAGVPTMIIRKDGTEIGRIVGARDKRTILATIQHVTL